MNDIEILKEINQNSKMGMDTQTTILKKETEDEYKDI